MSWTGEDHEWELPGEHPERYLPECPGPEEGLEWKLSECPGHPERHLPECGVKSLNRVIVVNRYILSGFTSLSRISSREESKLPES